MFYPKKMFYIYLNFSISHYNT